MAHTDMVKMKRMQTTEEREREQRIPMEKNCMHAFGFGCLKYKRNELIESTSVTFHDVKVENGY